MIDRDREIYYVFSETLLNHSNKNPAVLGRAKLVHSLISSYKLLKFMKILPSKRCQLTELCNFHAKDYIKFIKNCQDYGEDNPELEDCHYEEYGLGYDCPIWPEIYDYVCEIAGSTLTACQHFLTETLSVNSIIINWFGGWHHAQRFQASGYCYINDIVIGILALRQKYQRILYVDLDVHHGDGVQNAFEPTKHVLTFSMHQYEPGYYPGSGGVNDCGFGAGKGYSINFPYKSGIIGDKFLKYFQKIMDLIEMKYKPEIIVVQCGGDAIIGDPLGNTNLTPQDMKQCIDLIVKLKLPTLFLGGGGYNFPNTSRYWTELTATICGCSQQNELVILNNDIPDHEYFLKYSPGYELLIKNNKNIQDSNFDDDLHQSLLIIEENLIKFNVHDV